MAISYTQLAADIQSYTQNSDPTFLANVNAFISTAERRIYTEAKVPAVQKSASVSFTQGSRGPYNLPTGHVTTRALSISTANGTVNLLPKAQSFLDEMYPVVATQAPPKYYAQLNDTTFQVAPTPDQGYTANFWYAGLPASIVTASTTWLGNNFEQLLLYACLLEAYVFMKGAADVMAFYKAGYDAGIKELMQVIGETKQHSFRA